MLKIENGRLVIAEPAPVGPRWCKSHGPVTVTKATPEQIAHFEVRALESAFTGHMVVAFRNGHPVAGIIL